MPVVVNPIANEVAKVDFPQRPPRRGDEGDQIVRASANNFLVNRLPDKTMFHYDAISYKFPNELRPKKDEKGNIHPADPFDVPKVLTHKVIFKMQVDNPTIFTGAKAAYDGRKNLYLIYEPKMPRAGGQFTVVLDPLAGRTGSPLDHFDVAIKFATTVDIDLLRRFVKGGAIADSAMRRTAHINAATAVMFVNEMLRTIPMQSDKWINAGRMFLSAEKSRQKPLPQFGIVLVSGFFMSVRPCLSGIAVNVDSAVGLMYPNIDLLTVIQHFLNIRDIRKLRARDFLQTPEAAALIKYLKGVRVVVTVGRCPEKGRKIAGLTTSASEYDFPNSNNETVTIKDHYRRVHNYTLSHPDLICVQVGFSKEKPIVYPVEVCMIASGQLYTKAIPPDVTREMLRFGPNNPANRLQDIVAGFKMLELNEAVRSNGINVDANLLQVQGRVLRPPQLWFKQRDGSQLMVQPPPTSQYTLPGKAFMTAAHVKTWAVLTLFDPRDRDYRDVANRFARALYSVLGGLGMNPTQPMFDEAPITSDIPAALDQILQRFPREHLPLIVIILPQAAAEARHAVKWWGDTQKGVPTQCVRIDKIRGVKDDYLHNLALKINTRLGGINHYIDKKAVPWGSRTAMVIGADVSHPPAGETSQPSVSAMCASIDAPLAKYIATSQVQTRRNESIEDFQGMMMYLLEGYRRSRDVPKDQIEAFPRAERLARIWPSIIVIYRDGVGEGQYAAVTDQEVAAAQAAVQAMKERYNELDAPRCTISYIIVSKKHHQRFFPESRSADKKGNCFPGSVFDDSVAHPTLFDFYLQSQAAIIGTARPAHYILTYDENRFSVKDLQELSYHLCYVYARATRSVSIPAPVYYADIICGRSKFMFKPGVLSDTGSVASGGPAYTLQDWQRAYTNLHSAHQTLMYFI